MNIFDQFGIKEVADVTLYAIELNKYDEEVYIPVMYLNTLKVSTIEQSASQSFAKGGIVAVTITAAEVPFWIQFDWSITVPSACNICCEVI